MAVCRLCSQAIPHGQEYLAGVLECHWSCGVSEVSKSRNVDLRLVSESANIRGYAVGTSHSSIYAITLLERPVHAPPQIFTAEAVTKGIAQHSQTMVVGRLEVVDPMHRFFADRTNHWDVAPGGVSIGNIHSQSAGTLGGVVKVDGRAYILSNAHVLSPLTTSAVGDGITQPGVLDGGNASTVIATLSHEAYPRLNADNFVDAALARSYNPSKLSTEILGIGFPTGTTQVTLNQSVRKSGRTTGTTVGTVVAAEATVKVNYGSHALLFRNQFIIEGHPVPFSRPGDSGSLVVNGDRRVMGLLFAGSEYVTLANPIDPVLRRFGATLWV